jgi:hypothetical protein
MTVLSLDMTPDQSSYAPEQMLVTNQVTKIRTSLQADFVGSLHSIGPITDFEFYYEALASVRIRVLLVNLLAIILRILNGFSVVVEVLI